MKMQEKNAMPISSSRLQFDDFFVNLNKESVLDNPKIVPPCNALGCIFDFCSLSTLILPDAHAS